jgi:hypothetical protein
MAVEGDTLTIEPGGAEGGARTLSLADHPEIRAIVEGVRATLAGDLAALRRHYDVAYEDGAANWLLTLVPSDESLRRHLKSMRISGQGTAVRTVETVEANGDRSVMTVVEDPR